MQHDFHAHIYFDAGSLAKAKAVCETAHQAFGVEVGRMHEKPVGPHPMWSCQLAFHRETFGDFVPWLALNRKGLIVFLHPETGNAVRDHTEHAMWMGEKLEIDITALS